jgi:hypothetical protein
MLDRVASSLESKGLLKEAEEVDAIANTFEATLKGRVPPTVVDLDQDVKSLLPPNSKFKVTLPEYYAVFGDNIKLNEVQFSISPGIYVIIRKELIESSLDKLTPSKKYEVNVSDEKQFVPDKITVSSEKVKQFLQSLKISPEEGLKKLSEIHYSFKDTIDEVALRKSSKRSMSKAQFYSYRDPRMPNF